MLVHLSPGGSTVTKESRLSTLLWWTYWHDAAKQVSIYTGDVGSGKVALSEQTRE